MSRENVEIARRALAAFNRRDLDGFFEESDSDVVWDWSRAVGPEVGIRRGREQVARFINSWWEAFDESFIVEDDVVDAGRQVVFAFHGRQRGRTSGAEVRGPGSVLVWTFRDGKVVDVTLYQTRNEALAAVGLSE